MHHTVETMIRYLLARCTRGKTPDYGTLAALLGVDSTTVRHWLRHTRETSAAVVRLLDVLDTVDEQAPWLMDVLIEQARCKPPRERVQFSDAMERERWLEAKREQERQQRMRRRGW